MILFRRIGCIGSVLLVALFLTACGSDPKVVGNIAVIDDTSTLVVTNVESGGVSTNTKMVFESSDLEALAAVEKGGYVVSGSTKNAPQGFLKKVTEIEKKDGKTVLTVENAKLTEVVEEASISIGGNLNLNGMSSNLKGAIYSNVPRLGARRAAKTGITVYGDERPASEIPVCADKDFYVDFNNVDIEGQAKLSGCVGFSSDFVFDMDIKNFETTYSEFSLTSSMGCQIDLEVTAENINISQQVELAKFDVSPIVFMIGPVPVVIIPEIRMVLGLDGQLDINVTAKASNEITSKIGLKYKNRVWSEINEKTHTFDYEMPVLNGTANATVYTGPEMDFMFYGIAGPGGNVYIFTRVASEFDHYAPETNTWEVWAGFQAGARFTVEILDTTLFKISEPNIVGYEGLIASSEYNGLAEPGIGHVIGSINDAVTGKIILGDHIVENNISGVLVDLAKGIAGNAAVDADSFTVEEANVTPVWRELKLGGYCLEADFDGNMATIRPAAANGSDNQKWWMDMNGVIHSKLNLNRCIDGMAVSNGSNLVLYDCNGSDSQRWINDNERLQSAKINSRYITFTTDTFGWVEYLKVKNYQDSEKQVANWGTLENTSDVLKN